MKAVEFFKLNPSRLVYALCMAIFAGLGTGCSTEPVPYVNPDPPETAWYAYQQCTEAYGSRARICDNAGYSDVQGTYYYVGAADTASLGYAPVYTSSGALIDGGVNYTGRSANSYHSSRGAAQAFASTSGRAPSQVETSPDGEAFSPEVLQGLDDETLEALTRHWLELAKSAP